MSIHDELRSTHAAAKTCLSEMVLLSNLFAGRTGQPQEPMREVVTKGTERALRSLHEAFLSRPSDDSPVRQVLIEAARSAGTAMCRIHHHTALSPTAHDSVFATANRALNAVAVNTGWLPWTGRATVVNDEIIDAAVCVLSLDARALADTEAALEVELNAAMKIVAEDEPEPVYFRRDGLCTSGKESIRLEDAEAIVVQALVELRAATKDGLISHSGVEDAVAILRRIKTKHPMLARAIVFPGGRGKGGYSTTIEPAGDR